MSGANINAILNTVANSNLNSNQNSNLQPITGQERYITYGQMNLINEFRTLWRDLVIWMRSYTVSTLTGFSNIDSINKRIYRIPEVFKERLQPFFGVERSEQSAHLLLMYITSMQALFNAEIANNQQDANDAMVKMYRFADEIANLLASINPYWSKVQWQYLLYDLNSMAVEAFIAMISGEYDKELDIRDRMLVHALILGDYMAGGIMHYLIP